MAQRCETEKIFLSEQDLLAPENLSKNTLLPLNFRLLITHDLQGLLLVEKQISELYYQISITFDNQAIAHFSSQILPLLCPVVGSKLELLLNEDKFTATLQQEFIFKLLDIVTKPLAFSEKYYGELKSCQPIEFILRNRLEQERILQQVTRQIQQNLDLLVILKMTIEQVQHLLQIDRLVIYQLNVPLKSDSQSPQKLVDLVTYEAKASEIIPSILNFKKDGCFPKLAECRNKYKKKFTLVINDIAKANLAPCLKNLMQQLGVKAKVAIPIIVQNKLWGLLIAHQCFSSRQWQPSEVKFLQCISEYLAVAIYQCNSYQQLQEQKKLLEQQIQTRAKQLQDALIAAEIAHQSKTEFLGNISHELRTPLTCVIGLSGTLLHYFKENYDLPINKQKKYLEVIQDSGRKLLQLINNILDFAEIESGKSLLKIEELSLEDLSKKVWFSSLKIAGDKGIKAKLDLQINPENNKFFADGERLTQILFNLIENGIKFTSSGGEVILRVWRENNQVVFQVEDTGIGIYQEQLPLLFNKFQQLESYRSRTHGGTGLGLALTKHLVELHGGIIEVESIVGKGSIFTVFIPNYQGIKSPVNSSQEQVIRDNLENNRIVIVSTDEEIATFICELLTAAQYQVIWLIDSSDAISKIKVLEPKVVILDQELEHTYQITHKIKSWKKHNQIKIMMICQEIRGDDWQELSANGIDDYLLKPLQPKVLLQKISKIINAQ
jgi:two-component system sensor histidine kinase/response regulator